MEWMYANLNYWFVDHPAVKEFEWIEGQTFGASTKFLATSVIAYLSLTALLNSSLKRNTLSPLASSLQIITPIHNLVLLILSFIMAVGAALSIADQMLNYRWLFCFPPNNMPRRGPIFFWGYIYYLSKIIEFSDTLLIILSGGGGKRLTFLHVYHHTAVFIMSYIYLHTAQSLFPVGIVINSCVHMLMYTYYMMCSLGRRPAWKRLVTDFQIFQFVFGIFVGSVTLKFHFEKENEGCSGIWGGIYNYTFVFTLLGLFVDFHRKSYGKKNKRRTE